MSPVQLGSYWLGLCGFIGLQLKFLFLSIKCAADLAPALRKYAHSPLIRLMAASFFFFLLLLLLLYSQKTQQNNWPELESGWVEIKVKKTLPEGVSGRHGGVSVRLGLELLCCCGVLVCFVCFPL